MCDLSTKKVDVHGNEWDVVSSSTVIGSTREDSPSSNGTRLHHLDDDHLETTTNEDILWDPPPSVKLNACFRKPNCSIGDEVPQCYETIPFHGNDDWYHKSIRSKQDIVWDPSWLDRLNAPSKKTARSRLGKRSDHGISYATLVLNPPRRKDSFLLDEFHTTVHFNLHSSGCCSV